MSGKVRAAHKQAADGETVSGPGRPKAAIPSVEWKVYIRADLAAQVELLLTDPMRERVKYGARGRLLESLLQAWLDAQRKEIAS